ncbi:hypothetical protein K469DRAFT_204494 [Zopfia rhizophila CBS 207.26]|uniref:Uncharacterized protein n=1 Tax=Zopfia rhizophila CBS 207.26 TaxID=1314779 RepID=A0A6A6DWM9_9PEZI|nr:hypothetical protein K469DRAFT_204494 [Zopfia rhizophila CBS 207.26]
MALQHQNRLPSLTVAFSCWFQDTVSHVAAHVLCYSFIVNQIRWQTYRLTICTDVFACMPWRLCHAHYGWTKHPAPRPCLCRAEIPLMPRSEGVRSRLPHLALKWQASASSLGLLAKSIRPAPACSPYTVC